MKIKLLLFLLLFSQIVFAQNKFVGRIKKFETEDSIKAPVKGQILLLGSSTLDFWKTYDQDLLGYSVINRGVGATQMVDVNELFERWVLPYEPSWILLYQGDNDIAANKTPEQVLADYQVFAKKMKVFLPTTKVAIYSLKPSILRVAMLDKQKQTNELLKKLVRKNKRFYYIDEFSALIGGDGQPLPDIFAKDNLHLNPKGYTIWAAITRQFLATHLF